MGIGTLILFIAMILVAAIAAGVLLTTAISLQSSALLTGRRTTTKVSSQVEPLMVFAEDANDSTVDYFYVKISLTPGSQAIKFEDVLVALDTKNTTKSYSYSSSVTCNTSSTMDSNTGNFGAAHLLESSTSHNDDYIVRGEIVELCFKANRAIGEDEEVTIQMVPKVGNPVLLNMVLPTIMNSKRVFLYP
jgi:archaellin